MKEYIEPIVEITIFTEDVVTVSTEQPQIAPQYDTDIHVNW